MCFYCKGSMKASTTIYTVQLENCLIIIKNVPCEECELCGATEISDDVMKQLENMIDSAKILMQEIAVIDYSKVA